MIFQCLENLKEKVNKMGVDMDMGGGGAIPLIGFVAGIIVGSVVLGLTNNITLAGIVWLVVTVFLIYIMCKKEKESDAKFYAKYGI
jgi:hypothetical protein